METADRGHHATIITPRGSVAVMPFLTQPEAEAIAEAYGPPADPMPRPTADAAEEETASCGKCGGNGCWYEPVEVTTPSGGKVVTQKRVNCRPCGGTGRLGK